MKRVCILLLSLALLLSLCACRDAEEVPLRIFFLDVGQGDAMLVRTADGDLLIDAGTEESQETLCLRLEQLGVTELLLAVFTHADGDHMGGADGVLERFPTKEIWVSEELTESESARRLASVLETTDTVVTRVRSGMILRVGEVVLSVLYPFAEEDRGGNENSIVLKLHYKNFDAILMGDAGEKQEKQILDTYGASQLACDLYKVGHHGSNTSSSAEFLAAVKPIYAIIGCGAANSYGHPTGEVLERLTATGAEVLRTDLLGELAFETDGETLFWRK